MAEFKLKCYYKTPWGSLKTTLGYLRFKPVQSSKHQATLPPVIKYPSESRIEIMSATRIRVRFAEDPHLTQEELGEVATALEIPKSPRMSWPQKDKQTMGPV